MFCGPDAIIISYLTDVCVSINSDGTRIGLGLMVDIHLIVGLRQSEVEPTSP